jgi:hypothetical protein
MRFLLQYLCVTERMPEHSEGHDEALALIKAGFCFQQHKPMKRSDVQPWKLIVLVMFFITQT